MRKTAARHCVFVVLLASTLLLSSCARPVGGGAPPTAPGSAQTMATEVVASVSPALARYQEVTIQGDLWKRPGLSPRDRSVVTVAALIARNQGAAMRSQFERALGFLFT
jgi:4-carboxymuconolactone decarboxylase